MVASGRWFVPLPYGEGNFNIHLGVVRVLISHNFCPLSKRERVVAVAEERGLLPRVADFRTDGAIASPGSENMEPTEPSRLEGGTIRA